MAKLIFGFIIVFLDMYTYYGAYRVVLGAKARLSEGLIAVILLIVTGVVTFLNQGLGLLNLAAGPLLGGLTIPFLLKGKTLKWLGMYFPVFGVITTISTFVDLWLEAVNSFAIKSVVEDYSNRFLCILLIFGMLYIVYGIKGNNRTIHLSAMHILLLNASTFTVGVAMGGYQNMFFEGDRHSAQIYVNCVLVMCFICYFLAIYSIYVSKKRAQEKYALEHQKDLLRSQREQINAILESEKTLRACRHDFRTHLYALDSLASAGDTEGVRKYCADLVEDAKSYSKAIISGNVAVDGILGRAIDKCNEKGIEFKSQVSLPKDCRADDSELCIIFSNIMSNAIEACEKGDVIELICYPYNDLLCILERNPIHGKLEYDGDKLATSKEDKADHGHGVENIRAVIDKYDGCIKITEKEGMFNMEMLV